MSTEHRPTIISEVSGGLLLVLTLEKSRSASLTSIVVVITHGIALSRKFSVFCAMEKLSVISSKPFRFNGLAI